MIASIFSGLMTTKKRKLIRGFPESWMNLWDLWEIRIIILLSLILQCTLFLLGNRRKFSTSNKQRIILWLSYTAAESIATVALSILSKKSGKNIVDDSADSRFMITAFWAPFLLLHLGGPDTISAYSMEDNELWLRHLLKLGVQSVVAAYVFKSSWNGKSTTLNFMAIPLFMAGIIKSGERTWTLWQGSSNRYQESLIRESDPGPNYVRYMEEYKSKKEEGFDVSLGKLFDFPIEINDSDTDDVEEDSKDDDDEVDILSLANSFFANFKHLFANLILSFEDIKESQKLFTRNGFSSAKAFKVIEIELGFTYDFFYTKAALLHSLSGVFLRLISSSCTFAVLLAFWVIKKDKFPEIDVIITYVLLVGAIILEIYAVFVQLSSDWTLLWLGSKSKHKSVKLNVAISSILRSRKRWSNTMGQYNLIAICLNTKPANCSTIQKKLSIYTFLEKYRYKDTVIVEDKLKDMIFQDLKLKAKDINSEPKLCACRGDWVLRKENVKNKVIVDSVRKVEFDQSILLWHIATDLCYYADLENKNVESVNGGSDCEARPSRILSHYMLYLLVMCPFMLPSGIGQIRFRDTRAEATDFFREASLTKEKDACKILSEVCTDIPPSEVKGDRSKSALFDGCVLAKNLGELKTNKWKLIRQVWVEILSYAACQCQWSNHARQLRQGGELLSHVWLLMAHFGITEQLQISQGHARAKLIAR